MEVNGLPPVAVNDLLLPADLVQAMIDDADRTWHIWSFKQDVNAYGDEMFVDFSLYDLLNITDATEALPDRYPDIEEEDANEQARVPGFLPYIADYSKIVVFGRTGSGEPFCLDYRDDSQEPKVIFFRDGYWRRVAPDFASFWNLLEPWS